MPRKKKTDTEAQPEAFDPGRIESLKLLVKDCLTDEPQSRAFIEASCKPDGYSAAEIGHAVDQLISDGSIEKDGDDFALVESDDEDAPDSDGHNPTEHDDDGPLDLEASPFDDELEDVGGDDHEAPAAPNETKRPAQTFGPTRYLKHLFTEGEVLEMRLKRESLDAETDTLQTELDSLAKRVKHLKSRIDANHVEGLSLSRCIRFGSEMRDVVIEERKEIDSRPESPTKGKLVMVAYRTDTEEAIDWRELSYRERQGDLFDPAAATPAVTEQRAAN
jgi:hypothetical protein